MDTELLNMTPTPHFEIDKLKAESTSSSDVIRNVKRNSREDQDSRKEESDFDSLNQNILPEGIVWQNVIMWIVLHSMGLYGIYSLPFCKWQTWAFAASLHFIGGMGVTAGVHRLFAHRTYKAKLPLRAALIVCNTIAAQNDIIEWCRDHRLHHKYTETNADPHNALRGFFFSHMGWLMMRKHEDVKIKGAETDMDDLLADPLLVFQRRHITTLILFCTMFMPTIIPMYFWDESFGNAYSVAAILRVLVTLHTTWFVNSIAHIWGMRPYDESINPAENEFVSFVAGGEGYHNYHHVFPHDYKTSEWGVKHNITMKFIHLMEMLGQAYDLRTVSKEMILARRQRTGTLKRVPAPTEMAHGKEE